MSSTARSFPFWWRAALCCATALLALVLLPRAASAYVTCANDPASRIVNVTLHSPGDVAAVVLGDDEEIYVQGKPCGGRWWETSMIYVTDLSGADTTVQIHLGWEWPIHGYGDEIGGSSEIEWWVNGGAGDHDAVQIYGIHNTGMLTVGEWGINLNVEQELYGNGVDTDIGIPGVEQLEVTGYEWASGQGGYGTGTPSPRRLGVHGGGGDDFLEGADGPSLLSGGNGNDVLVGGAANDTLEGGPGDDDITGAGGDDEATYADAPTAVSVDLSVASAQDTGGAGKDKLQGVERLTGSAFADRLTGSAGANAINGGAGGDTLIGGEGPDSLGGGADSDSIDSRDSSPDRISCGTGPDTLDTDALDTREPDCPALPGAGSTDSPTDTPPSDTAGSSDAVPPVLTLTVPRQPLRRVLDSGLRVVLRCSSDCRASGRLLATRAAARRLGLGTRAARRTVGRLAPVSVPAATARSARVRLTRTARRALRRARGARLVLRARAVDGAGQAGATVTRKLRLRR